MKKYLGLLLCIVSLTVKSQDTLPAITVKNLGGHIIVSWVNKYKEPIANINIQRSYDSLKNYTTIGSVLNAQNSENGYTDPTPPYTRMYYRVFVGFEGGKYVITRPARPIKMIPPSLFEDSLQMSSETQFLPVPGIVNPKDTSGVKIISHPDLHITIAPPKPIITYPSQRIFTGNDQNVIIHLPEAATKNYLIKFYDDKDKDIFSLTKLTDEYLIIEKVNFVHSGWFRFELFENGELLEKNKFFIAKDVKGAGHQK